MAVQLVNAHAVVQRVHIVPEVSAVVRQTEKAADAFFSCLKKQRTMSTFDPTHSKGEQSQFSAIRKSRAVTLLHRDDRSSPAVTRPLCETHNNSFFSLSCCVYVRSFRLHKDRRSRVFGSNKERGGAGVERTRMRSKNSDKGKNESNLMAQRIQKKINSAMRKKKSKDLKAMVNGVVGAGPEHWYVLVVLQWGESWLTPHVQPSSIHGA